MTNTLSKGATHALHVLMQTWIRWAVSGRSARVARSFLSTAEFIDQALTKTEVVVLRVLADHLDQGQTKAHDINFRVSKPI
jgi:hypothetical protein